jgi:hypothetical protein
MKCIAVLSSLVLTTLAHAGAPVACPCTWDLNLDGQVDGADLGIMLANWDTDAPGDFDDSGVVDGADLGVMLANWGLCPAAVPSNDLCSDAIEITGSGWVDFCNFDATTQVLNAFDCVGEAVDAPIYHDIWYTFAAPDDGALEIFTCDEASFPTKMALYSSLIGDGCACPVTGPSFVSLHDCAADNCGSGSYLWTEVSPDKCYTIRLGGAQDQGGVGSFYHTFVRRGDSCQIPHQLGSVFAAEMDGDNFDDTSWQADPSSCGSVDNFDEWYEYTMPCDGNLYLSTCSDETDFDTVLSVYDACGGLELSCNDDSDGYHCDFNDNEVFRKSTTSLFLNSGQTVFIRVAGYQSNMGHFKLTLQASCLE